MYSRTSPIQPPRNRRTELFDPADVHRARWPACAGCSRRAARWTLATPIFARSSGYARSRADRSDTTSETSRILTSMIHEHTDIGGKIKKKPKEDDFLHRSIIVFEASAIWFTGSPIRRSLRDDLSSARLRSIDRRLVLSEDRSELRSVGSEDHGERTAELVTGRRR